MTKQSQEDIKVNSTAQTSTPITEEPAPASLEATLEAANARADENWEKLLRKEAELQNIRKRADQDVANARKYSIDRFAEGLLVVIDSFEQALQGQQPNVDSTQAFVEGMELTYKALLDALAKFGIEPINPLEECFNPQYHEAISMVETPEVAPNFVVAVVQKGFTIHDRVLRPARVVVSKASAP